MWFVGPDGPLEAPLRVVLRYRSVAGVANAVAAGIGLGPIPALIFDDPVYKQVLVPVLTDYPLRQRTLYVVYISRKHVPLKIRSFIDFLVTWSAQTPEPEIPSAP
jgi:DNA-binding transcriptional LysR family regulator